LSALPGIGLISKSGKKSGEKYICVKFNEADTCENNNLVSSEPLDLTHEHTVLLKQVKEEGSDNFIFSAFLDGNLLGTKSIQSNLVSVHNNVEVKLFKDYLDEEGLVKKHVRCGPTSVISCVGEIPEAIHLATNMVDVAGQIGHNLGSVFGSIFG